jgi:predicted RNA-binding Zn ribbon-like protein
VNSDNIALDFLNTCAYFKGRGETDRLSTPEQVRDWLNSVDPLASEIDVETSPPVARLLFDEAHRLRDAIRAAVEARVRGAQMPPRILYALNRVLEASCSTSQLVQHGERLTLIKQDPAPAPLAALSPIALAAAALLTDADPRRIRQCRSERCVLWFLDTSKNGRRQWCSMATCGNRAKAARHYKKQKAAD